MRVLIRGRGLDPALRDLARTRVAAALGRFASRVRSLRVHLADVNGPKGGHDQRCVIEVRLQAPARTAVIEELDGSAAAAISRAAERAGRAVARLIDTHHDRRHAAVVLSR